MIQVMDSYPVLSIKHFYIYSTTNHQDLKFMHPKNMALVIGLDGVEPVRITIFLHLTSHKSQE